MYFTIPSLRTKSIHRVEHQQQALLSTVDSVQASFSFFLYYLSYSSSQLSHVKLKKFFCSIHNSWVLSVPMSVTNIVNSRSNIMVIIQRISIINSLYHHSFTPAILLLNSPKHNLICLTALFIVCVWFRCTMPLMMLMLLLVMVLHLHLLLLFLLLMNGQALVGVGVLVPIDDGSSSSGITKLPFIGHAFECWRCCWYWYCC